MKRVERSVLLVFSITVIFFATQFTRFESDVRITYADGNFTAIVDGNVLTLPVEENFSQMTVQLQKAMLAENGVGEFLISNGNQTLAEFNPLVVHLFGKDVIGTLIKGNYPNFKKTFGDWTMDRFMSQEVVLYNVSLPSQFSMTLTFVGRGNKRLSFNGHQTARVDVNDGFLENIYGLCYADKCIGESKERFVINVKRIFNFFIEALLLSTIIICLITFLARRADAK